jgi:hypothetical protein
MVEERERRPYEPDAQGRELQLYLPVVMEKF